ncbi:hydrogenase/urease accessory protein HupE [Rhizomicrobium palustre]|uniref:Hydrogenase/urease accessory protein HupE n=1 Tax=Rhizomicrobium palustre TaxID=189966 RepID=A0A846N0L0_9PROT|nr:HupE/UreJ family protein [Rhizomicrobium palustre]NIK88782.1 hydrogenase/urease accessory protein HupE [Rhizomicrobium palustre]
MRFLQAIFIAFIALMSVAAAHEVRPAYLEVTERSDGLVDVLWKQPAAGSLAIRLVPHISGGVLERQPTSVSSAPNFEIRAWRGLKVPGGVDGRSITIEGLDRTITDVLVVVTLKSGDGVQEVLRPQNPSLTLHIAKTGLAVPAYLTLGIEHILTGIDHLSFVLGLLLLVRGRVALLKTITAFTIAHSITLAATTLHLITVQPALIEALVAFSILFVAVELVHLYRGREGLTVRYPWVIAFTFGLLHGSAFAGALKEIGLPPNDIPLSLLLFNVGVEFGQLLFVGAAMGVIWLLSKLPRELPGWTRWVPPYAIGGFAGFWFLERLTTAIITSSGGVL